jgi:hypothetical protein
MRQVFHKETLFKLLRVLEPATWRDVDDPDFRNLIRRCVIFTGKQAFATDGWSQVSVDFPTNFPFALPLKPFAAVMRALDRETVEVNLESNGQELLLRGPNSGRFAFHCVPMDEWVPLTLHVGTKAQVATLDADFASKLRGMRMNAVDDWSDAGREGVHLEFSGQSITMGTTNVGLIWLMETHQDVLRIERGRVFVIPEFIAKTITAAFNVTHAQNATLTFVDEYMVLDFAAGNALPGAVRVICFPPPSDSERVPVRFRAIYDELERKCKPRRFFAIPDEFAAEVEMGKAMMSLRDLAKYFDLTVNGGRGFTLHKKTMQAEMGREYDVDHGCRTGFAGVLHHDKFESVMPYVDEMAFSEPDNMFSGGAVFLRGTDTRALICSGRPIK